MPQRKKGAKVLNKPPNPHKRDLGDKKKRMKKVGKKAGDAGAKAAPTQPAKPVKAYTDKPSNPSEPEGSMVKHISVTQSQSLQKMSNRQKCLMLGSRNMSAKVRHLMNDLRGMLPHIRGHEKLQSRDHKPDLLKELCALHHCNSCIVMEGRKQGTTFMWLTQMPNGPSVKFELLNLHTADELRMAGNCLKFSRALLHFDHEFEVLPHLRIVKSMLTTVFNVPRYHPRSKPFIDHMYCFFYLDGRVWVRHYQIQMPPPPTPNKKVEGQKDSKGVEDIELNEEGPTIAPVADRLFHATKAELEQMKLMEVGPRFVLNPLTILNGAFSGAVIYKNGVSQTPTEKRLTRKMRQRLKMEENKKIAEQSQKHKERNPAPIPDPLEGVFQ
jgi:ribosome biogenesis protein BRX1